MLASIAAVFVVVQIVEVWLLIQIGHAIGGWQTLGLLVLDSLLGAALWRHQGRRTWAAFRLALEEHRMPAREVADGALVLVGGTLLITPGFLSDVVGVLCLLPPTRAVLRRLVMGAVLRRLGLVAPARRTRVVQGHVVEGDVVEGDVVEGDVVEGEVVEEVVDDPTREGPPSGGGRP